MNEYLKTVDYTMGTSLNSCGMLDCIISQGGHLIKSFRWTAMTFIQSEKKELDVDLAMLKQYARSSKSKANQSLVITNRNLSVRRSFVLPFLGTKERMHRKTSQNSNPVLNFILSLSPSISLTPNGGKSV